MSFSTIMECQLATHFSCTCPKCFGFIIESSSTTTNYFTDNSNSKTQQQESIEDLYQLQFTTTISSAPLSVVSEDSDASSHLHRQHEEEQEETKFSSHASSSDEKEVELQVLPPKIQKVKKLSRRQRRQQHQKSFLDVAKSLRDSPKSFRNKPAHIELSCHLHSEEAKGYLLDRINDRYREERRRFKRLRRRQYLPGWAYDSNDNSLRSIRELCCVFVGGEEEYKVIDRRAVLSNYRLPRSIAIAHRNKNRWIVRNRIFNVKSPFVNTFHWSDDATLNKHDSRGVVQRERDEKFNGMDGRGRCNRNGGYTRRPYRNNGYHQQHQNYIGNSRKRIFGKPWLFSRQLRINKGADRRVDFSY